MPEKIVRLITPVKVDIRFWREPVETVDDLPSSGNEVGDVRLVKEENALYWWNGFQWLKLAVVGNISFEDLTDTPSSLGTKYQVVRVNAQGTGLEFSYSTPNVTVPIDFDNVLDAIDFLSGNYGYGTVYVLPKISGSSVIPYDVTETINIPLNINLIGLTFSVTSGTPLWTTTYFYRPVFRAQVSPVIRGLPYVTGNITNYKFYNQIIANIELDGQSLYGYGIMSQANNLIITGVKASNFLTAGLYISGGNNLVIMNTETFNNSVGLKVNNVAQTSVINFKSTLDGIGFNSINSKSLLLNSEISKSQQDGVVVDNNVVIESCEIYNCNQSLGSYGGIRLAGKYNRIVNNKVYDNQATHTQQYGVYEVTGADYNLIDGNIAFGNVVQNYLVVGLNTVLGVNIG